MPRNGICLLNEFVPIHVDPADAPAITARWPYLLPCYTSRPAAFIGHKSETYPIDGSTSENLCLAEQVDRVTYPHYEMCFTDFPINFFFSTLLKFFIFSYNIYSYFISRCTFKSKNKKYVLINYVSICEEENSIL